MDNPLNGYPHGNKEDTNIIFIQQSGHEYHIIHTHGYSFTSLLPLLKTSKVCQTKNHNKVDLLILIKQVC